MDEVVKHDKRDSCWVVVDGLVYDVTHYVPFHPGGKKILLGAGKDSTDLFRKLKLGFRKKLKQTQPRLLQTDIHTCRKFNVIMLNHHARSL